jgi:O-succinylbenzoate synthase
LADASLDARLRSEGRSLLDELLSLSSSPPTGERPMAKQTLSRCAVIADLGASPKQLAELASEAADGGAAMVKIKIAPGHDVEQLLAVRAAIGDLPLAADANGSYAGLSEILAVDALGLEFLEQPFPAGLPWGELARLRSSMRTPLALDESLSSIEAVKSAVLAEAVDVVSVKPARLGGMRAAALAVETASSAGLGVFVGGMLELGIGRAGAAAVAALPGCNLPTDLGPSQQYVERDICDPICVNSDGELILPSGPGIGRVPHEEQLQQFCVNEVLLN